MWGRPLALSDLISKLRVRDLKSIQNGNGLSWKQKYRSWHSWWHCCQESLRTCDLLLPLIVISTETQTWTISSLRVLGGDRTGVAFESQFPEATLSLFPCLWLQSVQLTALGTALWPYFRKGACCSQRLSLWSPPLTFSQGYEINLLLGWALWKNGHVEPGTTLGLRTAKEAWLVICKYETRRVEQDSLKQYIMFFPLLSPC